MFFEWLKPRTMPYNSGICIEISTATDRWHELSHFGYNEKYSLRFSHLGWTCPHATWINNLFSPEWNVFVNPKRCRLQHPKFQCTNDWLGTAKRFNLRGTATSSVQMQVGGQRICRCLKRLREGKGLSRVSPSVSLKLLRNTRPYLYTYPYHRLFEQFELGELWLVKCLTV